MAVPSALNRVPAYSPHPGNNHSPWVGTHGAPTLQLGLSQYSVRGKNWQ
jgi:hypothetical protein